MRQAKPASASNAPDPAEFTQLLKTNAAKFMRSQPQQRDTIGRPFRISLSDQEESKEQTHKACAHDIAHK